MIVRIAWLSCLVCLACAAAPPAPAPGTGSLWGAVQLVPREGVTPGGASFGAYGDRRLRDVEFVDYSRPGFAVVYVEGTPPRGESCRISIEVREAGPRLRPAFCAVGAGGTLAVTNASISPHVVSLPASHLVRRLAPGESAAIGVPTPGEQSVYLLDEPAEQSRAFVAPGPYSIASPAGHYVLRDLTPGRWRIHVWHPRFPPTAQTVEVHPGRVERLDLELGVDVGLADERARAHP